jgi:hypothetical protein
MMIEILRWYKIMINPVTLKAVTVVSGSYIEALSAAMRARYGECNSRL